MRIGVVPSGLLFCSDGCGKEKTINHLSLSNFFNNILYFLLRWVWISTVHPSHMDNMHINSVMSMC